MHEKWFDHNRDKPVHHSVYSHRHIHMWVESHPDFDPTKGPPLPPEVVQVLVDANTKFGMVFDADKGSLPKAADHPPVKLNFKDDWTPVHCAEPRWGPGSGPVVQRWADEVLATGLYEPSTGPSASRPHIAASVLAGTRCSRTSPTAPTERTPCSRPSRASRDMTPGPLLSRPAGL